MEMDAWVTDRTFIGQGQRPIYENVLHLLDRDSTGQYTLIYQLKPAADTQAPTSHVKPLAAQSPLQFPVTWEGSDNTGVAFYDIHVSVDGGPLRIWLPRTRDTGALYTGELGQTYAFYSSRDGCGGQRRGRPGAARRDDHRDIQNAAPTLRAHRRPGNASRARRWCSTSSRTDPDGRTDLLRFAFTSAVPPGLTIDAQTGQIRWVTGEADGGREVAGDGASDRHRRAGPTATRSFTIHVDRGELPPVLAPVAPQRVSPEQLLTVGLEAQDADLPAQTLTYRFARPSRLA